MLLADTGKDPDENVCAVRSLARQADGLVVCVPQQAHRRPRQVLGATPAVFVNRPVRGFPSVLVDQRRIVHAALNHLYELGHRHLAHLAGPPDYWAATERVRHARAWADARADVTLLIVGPVAPTFDGGRTGIPAVPSDVTALATFNDLMALGAIAELAARGVSVPAAMSVVGSDDVPAATMASPSLTTVATPFDDVGRSAALLLISEIRKDALPATDPCGYSPELVVRASTAPAQP